MVCNTNEVAKCNCCRNANDANTVKAEVKAEDDKAADVKTEVCLCHSCPLCKHAYVVLYDVTD